MTAILYRSNLSSSKYYHLVEKCLNSIPEICDDLRGEYGVMNETPDLSYEHLMSAHAAGCVGRSFPPTAVKGRVSSVRLSRPTSA